MDRKQLVARLLAKAKKYRNFTRWLGDRETIERISELTEKLQRRARVVATPSERRIRRRARESGKNMTDQSEEMSSSGLRLNESFEKLSV